MVHLATALFANSDCERTSCSPLSLMLADVRAADALLEKEKTALGGGRKGDDSSDDEDMLVYDD